MPHLTRPRASLAPLATLALAAAGILAQSATWAGKREAADLAAAIIAHLRASLPSPASHSVDELQPVVRSFARRLDEESIYPLDLAKLTAAADAAIDRANGPQATADSLVRAAIAAVTASLGGPNGSRCEKCADTSHTRVPPTSTRVGTLLVASLPNLYLREASDRDPCEAYDHYLDLPPDVTGVVLDLRGNHGGYLPAAFCLAAQFLKPGTPLFLITSRAGAETMKSGKAGKTRPISLPLVALIDKDTDSGGLALAAALHDAGRATLIGERTDHAYGDVHALLFTQPGNITFTLPVGYISRLGGARLEEGVAVDVAVDSSNDEALMDAALDATRSPP